MLPVELQLNDVRTFVVKTQKEGSHTNYGIQVQTRTYGERHGEIVYRRFSAFLELQRLAKRHFNGEGYCCGLDGNCLLSNFLEPLFTSTEFPVAPGGIFTKNSSKVVRHRVLFLSAFLAELEEALAKCPPLILRRCEQDMCKMTKLLKSFYGCLAVENRPQHSKST